MREFIVKTKDGFKVYADMEGSHAATHFQDTPQLLELVKEALQNREACLGRFDVDMGRIIGTSDLVEVSEGDDIVYAKRPNRDAYARFVKNRAPQPTSYVTIELKKVSDTELDIFTAYIGKVTPSFPGTPKETPESRPFWKKYALAWGTQEIVPGTEVKDSPW